MKFVVLTNHRSGSSFFMRCLNSHPDIEARQEDLRLKSTRNSKFLDELYSGKNNFGFKCMYSHINDDVIDYFKNNDIKIIQLIRRDMLETVLWYNDNFDNVKGGLGVPIELPEEKVKVRKQRVLTKLNKLKQNIDKYKLMADFVVYYEDDLTGGKNAQEFYNKVTEFKLCEFIGVAPRTLKDIETHQQKDTRPPSSEIISNYNSLIHMIRNYGGYIETFYE